MLGETSHKGIPKNRGATLGKTKPKRVGAWKAHEGGAGGGGSKRKDAERGARTKKNKLFNQESLGQTEKKKKKKNTQSVEEKPDSGGSLERQKSSEMCWKGGRSPEQRTVDKDAKDNWGGVGYAPRTRCQNKRGGPTQGLRSAGPKSPGQ